MNKKLDNGVKYIKLIFGELTEHKGILTEMKDAQLKMIRILEKIEKKTLTFYTFLIRFG